MITYQNARETSERLGVPITWVYLHVRKKGEDRIPHRKAGKYLRFVPEGVDRWLKDRTRN